jgi:plastocyanin
VKPLLIAALWLPLLAGAAEHRVVIDAMQFSPQVVEVKPGDTIVWENRDMFVHNVTGAAAGVGSGDLQPGKSWRYVVRAGPSFDYLCTLHPVMKGRVNVTKPPRLNRGGGKRLSD